MCEELENEVKRGSEASRSLAIHLANMGASKCEEDVEITDKDGNVCVFHVVCEFKELISGRIYDSLKSYRQNGGIDLDSEEGRNFLAELSKGEEDFKNGRTSTNEEVMDRMENHFNETK